jgi:hypothetical protein
MMTRLRDDGLDGVRNRCFVAHVELDEFNARDIHRGGAPDDAPVTTTLALLEFDMTLPSCVDGLARGHQFGDASGLILNQMEYIAGRNTSVRIVPARVPPISV